MTSKGEHIRLDKGSVVKHHYEVVNAVGSGNFSKVYRVVDLQLPAKEQKRKPLAMKVIKKEYSSDAKYEKQMLIILHNNDRNRTAHVSKMYECFVFQECPVFIMPIHGPSIRNRRLGINRGVITREKLLEFAFDILETMDFVHFQCHMVHTDLKPENILIADSNVAENSMGDEWVVCDFGSASLWRMDKLDSDLISTRPYRAPEVVLGNKWHYAADMWSVGCILYEVAVGHRLFEIRDDLTHLHMMDRRIGKLPEAFTKSSKYSSKFFNARGEFLSTPDVIRFGKCRLTPIREVFRDDKDFLHLLESLLIYDPSRRMTATKAVALPMFDEIRMERRKRMEREAEEAEARRQRRRAAAADAGSDSLVPTINSTTGTTNLRLTDHSDHHTLKNTGDGKKTLRPATMTVTKSLDGTHLGEAVLRAATVSTDDGTAAALNTTKHSEHALAKSAVHGDQRVPDVDDADLNTVTDARDVSTLVTARSDTETSISRQSMNVSPGKSRGTASSKGSPHSTTMGRNGVPAHARTLGKTRPLSGSVSATANKSISNSNSGVVVHSSLTTSTTPAGTSVVMKELPNHRRVVDNHRSSTGTAVPKLALGRLSGVETSSNVPSTSVTPSKEARTVGSCSKPNSRQSSRMSTQRTTSPTEQSMSKPTFLSSHTPRKTVRASCRSSVVNADEAFVRSDAEKKATLGQTPNLRSAATHQKGRISPLPSQRQLSHEAVSSMNSPAAASASLLVNRDSAIDAETRCTPFAASQPESSLGAPCAATPWRASSATPVGYQSPLERGVTAVGITTRTEPPADISSPYAEKEVHRCSVRREDHSSESDRDHATETPEWEEEGCSTEPETKNREEEASNVSSPCITIPDGSPRATDYRSPARRRPHAATPTDMSVTTSLEAAQWPSVGINAISVERITADSVSPVPAATSLSKAIERGHEHQFQQMQPAPNMASRSPLSDGHRTPRKVSLATVTSRSGSPVVAARRSQQPSTTAESAATTSSLIKPDVHRVPITAPIVLTPPSRENGRGASLTGTMGSGGLPDALTRNTGHSSSFIAPIPSRKGRTASADGHLFNARSPRIGKVTPRAATSGARTNTKRTPAAASRAATAPIPTTLSAPSASYGSSSGHAAAAFSTAMSPSMKPVITVSASGDHLKSVLSSSVADVRGPSIPVIASRRKVAKPGPVNVPLDSSSGIPEQLTAHSATPLLSVSQSSAGVPGPPVEEAGDSEKAALSCNNTNSPNLSINSAADAAASKTPLPSAANIGGTKTAPAGLSSLLSSMQPHPTIGVVRQRSGSAHLVPSYPTSSSSRLESNPALTASQLGIYTPHVSRVLQEHQKLGSICSSATLPTVLSANNNTANGGGAPASPTLLPSCDSHTLLSLTVPSAEKSEVEPLRNSRPTDYAGVTSISKKPATLRGSGQSVKSLDLQLLHASTTTPGGAAGGTRLMSSASVSSALHSPVAPCGSAPGSRSPQYSAKFGGGQTVAAADNHGGQAALNGLTNSLRFGVMRSPRRPVAPGTSSSTNTTNFATTSLIVSVDAFSAVSLRSPSNSRRATNSPRGSDTRKVMSKKNSPRRGLLSPRTKPRAPTDPVAAFNGINASPAESPAAASPEIATSPVVGNAPIQPLQPQAVPMQGAARLTHPHLPVTVINSKQASSVSLSRFSNVAAVTPTRTFALRPPPAELTVATGKLQHANGFVLFDKKTPPLTSTVTGSVAASAATSPGNDPNSRPRTTLETACGNDVETASGALKYHRDARTLKRIMMQRPFSQSSPTPMVSLQALGDEGFSSISAATLAL